MVLQCTITTPMGLEWLLARRYLSSKKGRFLCSPMSVFSILGISIGVATLVSVMAVMSGFSAKLLHNILGMNGHITVHCQDVDYHTVIPEVESTAGVVSAVAVLEGQVMVKSEHAAVGAVLRGMEMPDISDKLSQYVVSGDTEELEAGIIIGSRLAESLNVYYGDEVVVISSSSFSTMPRTHEYKVTGIFNVGMYEYDSAFVYVPLESAQTLLGYDGGMQYVEVRVDDALHSSNIVKELIEKTKMRVEDWKVQHGQYFYALELERDAMFFILTLIIVVAAFNIISGISVLVQDKTKAVAVMRTMGLSKFAVARIFCMCGVCIGAIGTGIGCCLGVLFSLNMERVSDFLMMFGQGAFFESIAYCLEGIPSKMVFLDVVRVASLSLCISLIAALLPALRAAYQNPVDILKYE
ncbi:lipoprotein-releasing ABC transporter permease subunit [Anaplasma phagocytophilum]|nr:lipoprotein-releasing ABC transporter permease subunit [Anaplasma phagocytophilum]